MDTSRLPALQPFVEEALKQAPADAEERVYAENFRLDERPPEVGVERYAASIGDAPVSDVDEWVDRHHDYAERHLHLDPEEPTIPWTFRAENGANHLTELDDRQYLIRVERAARPCALAGFELPHLMGQVEVYNEIRDGNREHAEAELAKMAAAWNEARDRRPTFATTFLEVEELFSEENWAERLRDRLGLGHLSPEGEAIPILVMRYTVAEVMAAAGRCAVPTLLDGELSPYFYPSPLPGPDAEPNPCQGRTLNLTPVEKENDYTIGCELLHSRLDYQPEHFYRAGMISRPVTMPLERARRFHLPWVRLINDQERFGTILEGTPPPVAKADAP